VAVTRQYWRGQCWDTQEEAAASAAEKGVEVVDDVTVTRSVCRRRAAEHNSSTAVAIEELLERSVHDHPDFDAATLCHDCLSLHNEEDERRDCVLRLKLPTSLIMDVVDRGVLLGVGEGEDAT
jgi:hypothetical protein